MSKEEQEAIWYCSEMLADNENDIRHWKIVENLIDKQQAEIEELKEANKQQMLFTFKNNDLESVELVNNSYISKDKIRNKIDELIEEKGTGDFAQYIAIGEKLQVLREILEE